MRPQGDEAAGQVEAAGAEQPVAAESGDTIEMREGYGRLLTWILRIVVIGVAMWLIGTPLRSGAAVLLA
jgi:hypothetical protein